MEEKVRKKPMNQTEYIKELHEKIELLIAENIKLKAELEQLKKQA